MGRRVYEQNTDEFVWKYAFGRQPSEQYRISDELGLGCTQDIRDDYGNPILDVLHLNLDHIEPLKDYLEENNAYKKIEKYEQFMEEKIYEENDAGLKMIPGSKFDKVNEKHDEIDEDLDFYNMIKEYINFMESHNDQYEFEFQGDI